MQQRAGATRKNPAEIGEEAYGNQQGNSPHVPLRQIGIQVGNPLHHIVLPVIDGTPAPAYFSGKISVYSPSRNCCVKRMPQREETHDQGADKVQGSCRKRAHQGLPGAEGRRSISRAANTVFGDHTIQPPYTRERSEGHADGSGLRCEKGHRYSPKVPVICQK